MNDSTGTIRIVAAVLDTRKLTLYLQNGSTVTVAQGDPRIRRIIDEATPQLVAHKYADVSLDMDVQNSYKDFEEKSGKIRFFRVAKEKLARFFGLTPKDEEPLPGTLQLGAVPTEDVTDVAEPALVDDLEIVAKVDNLVPVAAMRSKEVNKQIIDEIMDHAIPSNSPNFSEEGLDKQAPITEGGYTPSRPCAGEARDTIIAVTADNQVVPGMERIKNQFTRASKLGSTTGVEKFLERLSKVIHLRRHSVEDLLKFMERADLPIANDGSIVIYKILQHTSMQQYPWAKYCDGWTGKVPQAVGCRVQVKEDLVDPNRNIECSNGLHVARRGYINQYGGTVVVLAKLAPEDVIAVPHADANKIRVCGYDLLFELTEEMYALLRQNLPITGLPDGKQLLARTLVGDHPKVDRIVEITQQQGGGIQVTDLKPKQEEPPPTPPAASVVEEAEALPDLGEQAPPVDPTGVAKEVETLTFKGRAAKLVFSILKEHDPEKRDPLLQELLQVKRASKYSWERLGVPSRVSDWAAELESSLPNGKAPMADPEPDTTTAPTPKESEGYKARIQTLLAITPITEQTATSILELKKKSKKGWDALKVPEKAVSQILSLTAK